MNQHYLNNMSDQELVNNVLKGDVETFKIIVKKTERLVAQLVFKMIFNVEDRKDISQDIYLKVYRNLNTFKFQSKLTTWICQIAYNSCLTYIKRTKVMPFDDLDEDSTNVEFESGYSLLGANSQSPEKQLESKQLVAILNVEITRLPPIYQTLVALFHQEELSYSEISEITQLPEGTVKSYLSRARKELKQNIILRYKGEYL